MNNPRGPIHWSFSDAEVSWWLTTTEPREPNGYRAVVLLYPCPEVPALPDQRYPWSPKR